MRCSITIVSFALLLASCDGEAPTPSSTSSTSPTDSSPPASSVSSSPETEPASADGQSVSPASGGSGDRAEGEALFNQPTISDAPGCVVCHSLEPGVRMVGPSLANAATLASGAAEGVSPEDYLRQSIVEPDAQITEGFTPGLMYQNYGDTLSSQQIDDLVAFLMTQT